jgi:DNA-binding NtrC family response regulator
MGSQISATRSTVLVVEDEALMRLLVVQALTDAGFNVVETSDGDIAVRILERTASRVRAVVSDISLPSSMNGVLLARHTRTHWPWIEVILVSGRPKPDDSAMPENTRFFQKPYDVADIVEHICDLAE